MNAPSQTAVIHKSSEANLSLSATLFVWVCAFDREKNAKSRKKKKEKRKEKKEREKNTQTQLPRFELALHRHLLAWVAETLPRSQGKKI